MTSNQLKTRLEQGVVWGIKQDNQLLSLALKSYLETYSKTYWIGYIKGASSSLPSLLQQLRLLAHHQGYSGIGGFFPNREDFLNSLEKAGYQRNGSEEYWVYQWTNL